MLAGSTCLEGLSDLMGIPIKKKAKYLGFMLSPVRKQLFHDAKANIIDSFRKIKNRIKFKNPEVAKIV